MNVHALDALGSPVRRDILRQLQVRPLAVNELARTFPISRPAISRHLRILQQANLVTYTGVGARSIYAVHMQGFTSVRAYLDEFWDTAFARIKELAEA